MASLHNVRRLVPLGALPTLVERRVRTVWADPALRAAATAEMDFLVGESSWDGDRQALARAYVEQMTLRAWMRWHPRAITRQDIRGVEWLTSRRDPLRGVLLNFMHHNRYDGLFGSLTRRGVEHKVVVTPDMMSPDAAPGFRQHYNVVRRGCPVITSTVGTEAMAAELRAGTILALASDVPGRTPVTFLGRKVMGSFGAARLAAMTDSPVVVVTAHREGDSSYVQVHEPLEPSDFADAGALLEAMLALHEPAILAWPEALESPTARFGSVDPQ